MPRILYELALADSDVRPSPYCWLVKFALLHKSLKFETRTVSFADKSKYPDPDYAKTPMLDDDGVLVKDSAVILDHLDRKYRDRPLVSTQGERAFAGFLNAWLASALYPSLLPLVMPRVFAAAPPEDQAYLRATREPRYGKTFEELAIAPDAPSRVSAALQTLAAPLSAHEFLGGRAANLCDYIVMSPLMWQRSATSAPLYETPKPVEDWRLRMLGLFDGYAARAKSAGSA